ncbi:hypothetical protein NDU88_003208 [Pleurodeles waltl]|uniref:Zinc finger CCHC domain-containing protein n=1 Tax=Pleurodeles waltl TaxID=8319 RepID=A0AAV7NK07_PLEWA|nr:hypothetical protein NDU88_003208 [Pleurodeles waltl]
MAASQARQNAVRFSAVEDVKMDGLLFSRSVLQKKLGFRPDQIDYLFAFPGDSCSGIEFACTALEHSSFSDTAVAAEVVEWGKDDIFVEEEVEAAMDISTSLKRKEKEGDDTEETGFESNDSRDLCTRDDRRNFQAVTG